MSFSRWIFAALLGTLPTSPSWAVDADPATRARVVLSSGLARIVSISADNEQGVWALTDSGKLYHCRRRGQGEQSRVQCVASEGPVEGGY